MAPRPTISARLDVVEGAISAQGETLRRLEGKVDGLGLNGSSAHIRDLAAATPRLLDLAAATPPLVELAQERLDAQAAARVRARRYGWVGRLDIARPWLYLGVALTTAAVEHWLTAAHLLGF